MDARDEKGEEVSIETSKIIEEAELVEPKDNVNDAALLSLLGAIEPYKSSLTTGTYRAEADSTLELNTAQWRQYFLALQEQYKPPSKPLEQLNVHNASPAFFEALSSLGKADYLFP